jgi:hypothetical protein
MPKSLEERIADAIAMASLAATGLLAIPAVFGVLGSVIEGKKPDLTDLRRAAGLLDGIDVDIGSDAAGDDSD